MSASTALPSPDRWIPGATRLRFSVGEYCLANLAFRSLVLHVPPTATDDTPALPFQRFPREVQAVTIYSCPVQGELPRYSSLPGMIRYVPSQYRHFFVDLRTDSFEEYLAHFSGKTRSTLRRKVKKYAEFNGGCDGFREYRTGDEMTTFHRLAREVSAKTYQEKLFQKGLPGDDAFLDQMRQLADAGSAVGYLLFHQETPVAYIYCPVWDGVLIYDYVGHDSEYNQWSPGTVLMYLVLEKLFKDRSFVAFDFTEGEGSHKELFATHHRQRATVMYFPKSLRNTALLRSHSLLAASVRGVSSLLDRMSLKQRIKRYFRHGK